MKINSINRIISSKTMALGSAIGLVAMSVTISASTPKHIAVPPQDMASQQILLPQHKGIFSESTLLPISANSSAINKTLLMDSSDKSSIIFLSPSASQWQMQVTNPNGEQLVNELNKPLRVSPMSIGKQRFSGKQFDISSSTSGEWQIKLTHSAQRIKRQTKQTVSDGFLMFKGDPDYKLYSYLDNNITTQNSDINIVAYMVNDQSREQSRALMTNKYAMQSSITNAYVLITSPSKQKRKITLNDNGVNGDSVAGDGLYSAKIPTFETGIYTSQVQIEGIRPDGIRYSRTATDIYPIEKTSFKFNGKSAKIQYSNGKQVISIPVKNLTNAKSIYLSAEVWGTNSKGQRQSAAWIGGVVSPNSKSPNTNLELSFDTRWLKRSQLRAPFALRSLRLQNVNNNVPIAELKKLPLTASQRVTRELPFKSELRIEDFKQSSISKAFATQSTAITQDMLMGAAPQQSKALNKASGTKLLLVHGYCSSPVWDSNHFSDAAVFQDYNQNRTHEEFAQRILSFGSPYSSYGIVAHSQGGAAALHLYSRYWSGLDYASGGRIIQSVGTPYQGTSLAGNLAAIGEIFGAGCGYATDLTYSGASNWLSTIPNWARSQVDYYTTSFTDKWWRWDYCHIASDLVLSDPDDGTTEKWAGQLSGAVNRGHKTGQCHTLSMRDPGQTHDTGRNSSMNSRAAR